MRTQFVVALLLAGHAVGVRAQTTAEFAVFGPKETTVVWGESIEVEVASTHNERIAACAYQLDSAGDASAVLTQRTAVAALRFVNSDFAAPLADGLPVTLTGGNGLIEVFLNLDAADPPGNPADGLAPGTLVTVAAYTLVASRAGGLTLTLSAPQAAETQSDPGGVRFDVASVASDAAAVTLTVTGGPDVNADERVDLRDYAHVQRCLGRGPSGGCGSADTDSDGDVDPDDFAVVQACMAGPAVAPSCLPTNRGEARR